MIAPIFAVCAASQAVRDLLGSPVRLYPFGLQDDNIVYPYALWQNISGVPENYLDRRPDVDSYTLQVDVYSNTVTSAQEVAKALRDAIEPNAYITAGGPKAATLKQNASAIHSTLTG
ncbi:Protein of uncharacterised function (DUF3168) [Klebsiella variicola]|nr:Protein of uncharacterised function (DUF3168) [Klebsiella variicola]